MNPQVKAKWLAKLRSNKYRQGKNWLRITDEEGETSFCCLGVLCELYNEEEGRLELLSSSQYGRGSTYDGEAKVLPPKVASWAGLLEDGAGYYIVNPRDEGRMTALPILNDTGYSFEAIADILEQQL